MGHFDTVPASPGQVLGAAVPGDEAYLFGRGALDMKSGIAVAMSLMAEWAKDGGAPAVSVLFVGTCDEEADSSGILRAIGLISALKGNPSAPTADREEAGRLTGGGECELLGVINVDYTTERFPGDTEYHAWEGSIGKLLAGVYVRGYQSHAGEYFRGFHAMGLLSRIITAVDGNTGLADKAPPPVTLKLADAKAEYNVMTSPAGRAYFNIFTTEKSPAQILGELRTISDGVIARYLDDLNASFRAWGEAAGVPAGGLMWEVSTITWSELNRLALGQAGPAGVRRALDAVRASHKDVDAREAGFAMIEALLDLLDNRNPVVVLAFLPPFYPGISPDDGPFGANIRAAIAACRPPGGKSITIEPFYPYISEMSYLRLDPAIRTGLDGLTGEMPGWGELYSLDFGMIAAVDLPVVNIGPYGFGAHQPEERVEREYTFTVLPGLLSGIADSL
jgi:arginine utilization protein RocB